MSDQRTAITTTELLRQLRWIDPPETDDDRLMHAAADEIERLREDLFTAHLLAARDASNAPGRISMAVRPFLAAAVRRHGLDSGSSES